MKRTFYGLLILICLLFGSFTSAQIQTPTGTPITVPQVLTLTQSLGGFLIAIGAILATLTIIISGILYFFAGTSQPRVAAAKSTLKAGLVGALIIFSVGIMVNLISGFATNPLQFFV